MNKLKKESDVKFITFETLHEISTQNKDTFNQNVWTEKLLEDFPKDFNNEKVLPVIRIMEHEHHRGKQVPIHYRCAIQDGNGHTLLQDMSFEQWNNLTETLVGQEAERKDILISYMKKQVNDKEVQ